MGMFDSVLFKCSNCGTRIEAQSKSGDCVLGRFSIFSAPLDVLIGLDYTDCRQCGQRHKVEIKHLAMIVPVEEDLD